MDNKVIDLIFQEPFIQRNNPMSLFRNDFKLENKAADNYLKFPDGDTKIRILSAFIDGWEEWDASRKPVRYKQKPETLGADGKQFVAAIVWNYNEKKIQIMQLTQKGIIRAIQNLSEDSDWGPVFFYDIKITRTGKDKLTKYAVNPLPAKPLDPAIEKAFKEKPCCLDAMYYGEDPFAEGMVPTPGIFVASVATPVKDKISEEQVDNLDALMGDDIAFRRDMGEKLKKAFGSSSLGDIPASQYEKIKDVILRHQNSQLKEAM